MSTDESQQEIARFLRRLQWAALGLFALWVVWLLSPVLTPFAVAALLAWMGDPLVHWLETKGRSRNVAVVLVFSTMALLLTIALLILVPLIEGQISTLIESLPRYKDWLLGTALPWVEQRVGMKLTTWLDFDYLTGLVRGNWEKAGGVAATLLGYVSTESVLSAVAGHERLAA